MSAKPMIEADYVVVGAGAVGMAIADTLISDSDRTVAIVDRRHRPGGHCPCGVNAFDCHLTTFRKW